MTPELVIDLAFDSFKTSLLLAGPMLVVGMIVGVLVSVLQAITQINEASLSFIPKLAAIMIVMLFTAPWMLDTFNDYTTQLYESIPSVIRQGM